MESKWRFNVYDQGLDPAFFRYAARLLTPISGWTWLLSDGWKLGRQQVFLAADTGWPWPAILWGTYFEPGFPYEFAVEPD